VAKAQFLSQYPPNPSIPFPTGTGTGTVLLNVPTWQKQIL